MTREKVMHVIHRATLSICAAFGSVAPAVAQDDGSLFPDAAQLSQLIDVFDIPELAMATLEDCVPRDVVTVGKADLSTGADVTRLTAFETASLTKPVFAYLVMTLVAESVIDLDQPIVDSFDYPRIADKVAYAQLTPRMILTHRTGLPNWVDEGTDFHERRAVIPFHAPPDRQFSYSGEAFQLLQAFVEDQTGQSLQEIFEARLGTVMPNSTLQRPLPDSVTPSRGYETARDADSGRAMVNIYDRAMAASSLATTADDYAAFLAHVCRADGLPPDLHADMIRPQSQAPAALIGADDGAGPSVLWGLGWMIVDLGPETLVGHGGSNDEYNSFGGFIRPSGDGIVLLINGANGQHVIDAILMPDGDAATD